MPEKRPLRDFVRTKIVATIGPATDSEQSITQLIDAGVNVFRINTAHGTRESHAAVAQKIRKISKENNQAVAILVDLAGPKIRLGEVSNGQIDCKADEEITFSRNGRENTLTSNYAPLFEEVKVGDKILFADGIVRMVVTKKDSSEEFVCTVTDEGIIRSRQGIALPGVNLSAPALTDADREHAKWAAEIDAALVSLSFVRTTSEIKELRELLQKHGSSAKIIAKIEKREALEHLDAIVQESDGIMVARGDLGLEIEIEATPIAQKHIIQKCRERFKPVIVATQMLESMHESKRPTRAEASDVANAILDGADACMLSGETAIGKHPFEAVHVMRRIIKETEMLFIDKAPHLPNLKQISDDLRISTGVVYGAAHIADQIDSKLIVIGTNRGEAPRIKSKLRDSVLTVAVSESEIVLQQLCLCWGIIPIPGLSINNPNELHKSVSNWAADDPSIRDGDIVVFVADTELIPNVFDAIIIGKIKK